MTQETQQQLKFLVKALRWQLRPLVRLLLKSGFTYPQFAELLKSIFIDVADKDFKLDGKQQTDSRINFLTGIHRKDVKRIRDIPPEENEVESASLGALLVSRWIGVDTYLDDKQQPLPLARLIKQGGEQSFEALVISVNKDIRSRAVLDEWLNLGIVSLDNQDRVCLNTNAFIPAQGYEEKVWFFGENLHDHLAAASDNVIGEKPPHMERAVFYDNLSRTSIEQLKSTAEQSGMRLLKKLNRQAIELQKADEKTTDAPQRMRFGIYFYDVDQNSEQGNDNG